MPRQPCCCSEGSNCCLYPGWHVNDGYYYADDPPENADPKKALDRNRFALNEVITDGEHDLTLVANHPWFECTDGVFKSATDKTVLSPTGAHSFKVVDDPIDVDINVTISNLLAFALFSFVNILIVKCDGNRIFDKNYTVPNYINGGGFTYSYGIGELCDEIPDQEFDTDTVTINPGFYTLRIGFYYGPYYFGFNKDAVANIDFGGFTVDNLCTKD